MSRGQVTITEAIRRSFIGGEALLVAVSGGVDSVTLLHALVKDQRTRNLVLEIVHLDHGLRGEESGRDAKFVESLSEKYALPFHQRRASGPAKHENPEAWGRRVRYRFFEEIRSSRLLDYVVTAHHGNDLAETFLMRILSNKELGSIDEFCETRHLIRPFLSVTRRTIDAYARENGLAWVEDATNNDLARFRNNVRHSLLPMLEEKFDPRIVEILAQRSLATARDIEYLRKDAKSRLGRLTSPDRDSPQWADCVREVLSECDVTIQWRLGEALFAAITGQKRTGQDGLLGRGHSERLVALLLQDCGAIELPGDWRVEKSLSGIKWIKR